jgi:hypothetical protein
MYNILHKKRLICTVKCLIIKEFTGFSLGTRIGRQRMKTKKEGADLVVTTC